MTTRRFPLPNPRRAVLAGAPLVLLGILGFAAFRFGLAGSNLGPGATLLGSPTPSEIPAATRPAWNAASADPDRIILTWSGDPATSQSVTWRTDTSVTNASAQYALSSPGPGFVYGARTVPAETRTVDAREIESAGVMVSYHAVTFTGLTPDTLYAYRVGDGERWSEWFHFRTASLEPEPFSFIYFGDAQNDILPLWSRVIRSAHAAAPDARFMLHAGDLVTEAHSDLLWGEWFRAGGWIHATVPSLPAPGNHEHQPYTPEEEEQDIEHLSVFWRPQFTLPRNGIAGLEETSYFVDYQGARIVVLNSDQQQQEQAVWLDRVLGENPNPWTIVTFHHPIFSSARDRDNAELRAAWQPIFDRHGVDLVLQGHDHTYARGRAQRTVQTAATTGGAALPTPGPVYVVSVSGRKMYTFKEDEWDGYDAVLDRRGENTQLFQVIRIAGDTLRYRAHTATSTLYDAFDLVRRNDGSNRLVERMPADAPARTFADGPAYRW